MKEAEVVGCFHFPPNQQASVAVDPRMDSFDDPATGLAASARSGLFTAGADVGQAPSAADGLLDARSVVALV